MVDDSGFSHLDPSTKIERTPYGAVQQRYVHQSATVVYFYVRTSSEMIMTQGFKKKIKK